MKLEPWPRSKQKISHFFLPSVFFHFSVKPLTTPLSIRRAFLTIRSSARWLYVVIIIIIKLYTYVRFLLFPLHSSIISLQRPSSAPVTCFIYFSARVLFAQIPTPCAHAAVVVEAGKTYTHTYSLPVLTTIYD